MISCKYNDNQVTSYFSAKNSIPTAPSTVGPVRRVLSPLHSNLLDFGGLTAHRRGTRDGSSNLLCSSTSEIRQSNRVTYEENVEEESGGFEEGGEKTRYGTLQKQRKQLNNDFRANSNTNRSATVHSNQVRKRVIPFLIKKLLSIRCVPYWQKFCFSFNFSLLLHC